MSLITNCYATLRVLHSSRKNDWLQMDFCVCVCVCVCAKEIETTVVKASVTTPETGGQIHMVIGITQETPEHPSRAFTNEDFPSVDGK